jgi:glutaredoxin-related protein
MPLVLAGIRTPDRPACGVVTKITELLSDAGQHVVAVAVLTFGAV